MTAGWREYFDGLKDQSPLYRVQAGVYVDSLRGAVDVRQHHRVLDFGCGYGFVPALLAPLVAEIGWWEPSLNMRSAAARNTATFANARFCDLSAMYSIATQEVAWPGRGFDLILINSVVQYMAPEEVWQWLHQWHAMLASGGRVVLSDLIPPRHSSLSDIACLLRLGSRQRSALVAANQALGGVGSYWRMRHARPLTAISKADLARHAAAARFAVTFLPANLTHFRQRWAAILHSPT